MNLKNIYIYIITVSTIEVTLFAMHFLHNLIQLPIYTNSLGMFKINYALELLHFDTILVSSISSPVQLCRT